MEFIWDGITDWIKEALVSGIISNLSGLFHYVNDKVADILNLPMDQYRKAIRSG